MTIQTIETNYAERALISAMNIVANTRPFTPISDEPKDALSKNQRATNEAIAAANTIVNNPKFLQDPETVTMRTLSVLNSTAKLLAAMNESFGYLSAYILCRRVTHQATYLALTAQRDAQRYEQQLLRSNVSVDTRKFIAADDWATEFATTEEHASAEELLLQNDAPTPRQLAVEARDGAEYVYGLLTAPMNTFCAVLQQFEKDLAEYLASVGSEYTIRAYLHSYTSVALGTGPSTEYLDALSFEEAESLLAEKAARRIESRANDMESIIASRNKLLRAI